LTHLSSCRGIAIKKSIYVIVIAIMGTILLGVNAVGLRVAAQTSDPVSALLADY
jgi:hypothetical protein